MTPYHLNSKLLRAIREDYRAIGIKASTRLWTILNDAGETSEEFAYLDAVFPYQSERAILLVPYPHRFRKEGIELSLALHRRLDSFFDFGRYLTERIFLTGMKGRT